MWHFKCLNVPFFKPPSGSGGPHIEAQYRQYPQLTKSQKFQSELISGAMWFWILWHCWHDPDAVLVSRLVVYTVQHRVGLLNRPTGHKLEGPVGQWGPAFVYTVVRWWIVLEIATEISLIAVDTHCPNLTETNLLLYFVGSLPLAWCFWMDRRGAGYPTRWWGIRWAGTMKRLFKSLVWCL